ncbi:phosphatidylinositol 3,4,5-trisphosphate 3-phosphatase TPTE2-like [Pseudonaja textilis]|uniref:phosphatidylinositol 3,4,5-trisphosphate 3-phosphatase TPTE2-like n=1 Tax=Pseudonaja textilis TaxID=8673 RepID=UPI000EAA8749|nr:phosphatidylinositol 3,4,5-trisphosphate 3-phosphatase TPTE2-like [Pseudonaja textilis]
MSLRSPVPTGKCRQKAALTGLTRESEVSLDDGVEEEVFDSDSWMSKVKKKISPYVMSFGFRFFGVVLIFLDVSLVILSLLIDEDHDSVEHMITNLCLSIALFFFVDVLLQVFIEGFKNYFKSKLNILDSIVVVGNLLVDTLYIASDLGGITVIPRTVVILRMLRIIILVRIFRVAAEAERLEKMTRRLVSENKRRYTRGGFDLDLTYVTTRVIAMSFPSSGQQAFYRNPIGEVAKFLDTKHGNHYKVYNLCSEQGYDPEIFHYRVERMFIDDHTVPSLAETLTFTANVRKWMEQDSRNVIAIHCKGGKGRTGTMICIWLIDTGQFKTAQESLEYFGKRRTDETTSTKFQGVETPSQSRYVEYYAILKSKYNLILPPEKPFRIRCIKLYAIQGVGKGNGTDFRIKINMKKEVAFQCNCAIQMNCKLFLDHENDLLVIGLKNCPVIRNDVKVRFEATSDIPRGYGGCAFFFCFHTAFIQDYQLFLPRNEIDNLNKSKMWKIFRDNFALEIIFTDP